MGLKLYSIRGFFKSWFSPWFSPCFYRVVFTLFLNVQQFFKLTVAGYRRRGHNRSGSATRRSIAASRCECGQWSMRSVVLTTFSIFFEPCLKRSFHHVFHRGFHRVFTVLLSSRFNLVFKCPTIFFFTVAGYRRRNRSKNRSGSATSRSSAATRCECGQCSMRSVVLTTFSIYGYQLYFIRALF